MADLRGYSHDFLTEFISLYRDNPCLWKITSKDYSNRNLNNAAYEVLCQKLKENDPNATKDAVIKKINSLRSYFRKEVKKASEKSGAGEDELYKPTLWYFNQLLFLLDQEIPRQSTSNIEEIDNDSPENAVGRSEDEEDNLEENTMNTAVTTPSTPASVFSEASSSTSRTFKRQRRNDKSEEILGLVANKLKSSDCQQYASYGKHIAEELRAMSQQQALYCQKIINDAIFEAKLGNLDRKVKIVTKIDNIQPSTISRGALLQRTYPQKAQTQQLEYSQQSEYSEPYSSQPQVPNLSEQFAGVGQFYSNFSTNN